jgi:thiamine pyrophosphate-dependent acetolactate synthase large subunit-like protein
MESVPQSVAPSPKRISSAPTLTLQTDGDLLPFSSGLWTIRHHDFPLFPVIHNNDCLYNTTRHRMKLAAVPGRDDILERVPIGTSMRDHRPDFAAIV